MEDIHQSLSIPLLRERAKFLRRLLSKKEILTMQAYLKTLSHDKYIDWVELNSNQIDDLTSFVSDPPCKKLLAQCNSLERSLLILAALQDIYSQIHLAEHLKKEEDFSVKKLSNAKSEKYTSSNMAQAYLNCEQLYGQHDSLWFFEDIVHSPFED